MPMSDDGHVVDHLVQEDICPNPFSCPDLQTQFSTYRKERMTKIKSRIWLAVVGLVVALSAVVVTARATSTVLPVLPTIKGVITLPGGSLPVPVGTKAMLLGLDGSTLGLSSVSILSGTYSFAGIAPGKYLVRGEPPIGSLTYGPSEVAHVSVLTQSVNVPTLTLSTPSITGTVYKPNGVTSVNALDALVEVYALTHSVPTLVEARSTGLGGGFSIGGLPTGTYSIVAVPAQNLPYWKSKPVSANLDPSTPQYITLTLQPAKIGGLVKDALNLPVQNAVVHAVDAHGQHRFDVSGSIGVFAIGEFQNGDVVTLTVDAPPDRGALLPPPPMTVTVPTSVTLVFGIPNKQVRGWVRTNTGISVTGALVEAHRIDHLGAAWTTTDASGVYTLTLAPGFWAVNVHPINITNPAHWVYPFPARVVEFDPNSLPERKFVNFKVLTADANVIGAVQMPDGSPPPFTVTVALHNDEGIGVAQPLISGHYSFNVPHGVYNLDLRVNSQLYAAPSDLPNVFARPNGTTIVPTITLIARAAFITGTLVDDSRAPAASVPVIAWSPETHATFGTRSGDDGTYLMAVYSGTWLVKPAPTHDQPYVYTADASGVNAQSGLVTADVNFTLTNATATLHGVLIDPRGHIVPDASGFASAVSNDHSVKTGAPIGAGTFDMLVPAGNYSVTVHLPGAQPYMSDGQVQVVPAIADQTTQVTFTLIVKDARFRGAAINTRTGLNVNVDGLAWAWNHDVWTGTDLKPGGFFTLPVPAGVWQLNYAIDPGSDYVKTGGARSYALESGQRQDVVLPVVKIDSMLTGTIVLTDGVTPAWGAVAIAHALSPDLHDLEVRSPVDNNGVFTLTLPWGLYNVRSSRAPAPRMINPREVGVFAPKNGTANVKLQYRAPDAQITGVITLTSGSPKRGFVHLYAWSGDDGYSTSVAWISGTGTITTVYHLAALAGLDWQVAAVYETPNHYWITRTTVTVANPGPTIQDLMLSGPRLKPAPVTVLLDPTQDRAIELSDGTRIFIPAGAIPATGNVILHITPLANSSHESHAEPIDLSYAFEAYTSDGQLITSNFNQDVVITFKVDPADLAALQLDLAHVRPAYFSTTTNSWTAPDSFVIDETNHEITMEIDHFTRFAKLGASSGGSDVFLPLVLR
jgi:hypothetical protein